MSVLGKVIFLQLVALTYCWPFKKNILLSINSWTLKSNLSKEKFLKISMSYDF